jgi:probable HAF family extracellular repeat protein
MKSETLLCNVAVAAFAVATSGPLGAQDGQSRRSNAHHHYQVVDISALGVFDDLSWWSGLLNKRGVATNWLQTSTPTSPTGNPMVCGGWEDSISPFVSHTFAWQGGVAADLGSLAGPDFCSAPFWINDRNEIVGASENGLFDPFLGFNQSRAVLWEGGKIIDLGTLDGGNQSWAFGINNRGQVAGISTTAVPDPYCFFGPTMHAFMWQHGQMQDLGTLGGNCSYIGTIDNVLMPINERGQIVGASTTSTVANPVTGYPPLAPFVWEEGKGMTDLGTLGGAFGAAQAINNKGQIIGQSSIAADPGACMDFPGGSDYLNCHAFLWDKGRMIDLNTQTIGGVFWFEMSINDAGEIVGAGNFSGKLPEQAALWRKGVATDLGNLGDCYSLAMAINSGSQIVGHTRFCDGSAARAFLWEKGSIVDLNLLIPPGSGLNLLSADDLNDRGEIAGSGVTSNGDIHEFLLIPCDERHPGIAGCDYSQVEVRP